MSELRPQAAGIPLPVPSAASAPYWEGISAGELRYQVCDRCDLVLMPPTASVCGRCTSRTPTWRRSAGRGTLRSWTIVWRPPTPAFHVPYAPAIVEVEEGFTHLTAIVDCDIDELRFALPVEVTFRDAGAGVALPYFRPDR